MMEIVPSAAMLTHGDSARPLVSLGEHGGAGLAAERKGEGQAGRADHDLAAGQRLHSMHRSICWVMAQASRAARSTARTMR